MKQKLLLICLFFSVSLFSEGHLLIYMIVPPRSLSTAFLRMMHHRGDFEVYSEPSLPLYLKKNQDRVKRNYRPDLFDSFDHFSAHLLKRLKKNSVFVKDTANTVYEFITKENALINNSDVQFVFMLRDPHATSISFYRKNMEHGIFEDMKEHFTERMGFKKLYLSYKNIESRASKKPYILLSENLYQNAEVEIKKLCTALKIPFSKKHLTWRHLEDQHIEKEIASWHEIKDTKVAKVWHGEALKSSCFHTPRSYIKDHNGDPTFEEIEDPKHRAIVKKAYEENLIFYHKLRLLAL